MDKLLFHGGILTALSLMAGYFLKKETNNVLIKTSGLTILIYRIITLITAYFYGQSEWWQGFKTDKWNHYQIGILILVAVWILKNKISQKVQTIAAGIGLGMIIDEVADLIKLTGIVAVPANFRDSPMDLGLIALTYLLAVTVINKKR